MSTAQKKACASFTPSKWAQWKCAVCFLSDKEHPKRAIGLVRTNTRRKSSLAQPVKPGAGLSISAHNSKRGSTGPVNKAGLSQSMVTPVKSTPSGDVREVDVKARRNIWESKTYESGYSSSPSKIELAASPGIKLRMQKFDALQEENEEEDLPLPSAALSPLPKGVARAAFLKKDTLTPTGSPVTRAISKGQKRASFLQNTSAPSTPVNSGAIVERSMSMGSGFVSARARLLAEAAAQTSEPRAPRTPVSHGTARAQFLKMQQANASPQARTVPLGSPGRISIPGALASPESPRTVIPNWRQKLIQKREEKEQNSSESSVSPHNSPLDRRGRLSSSVPSLSLVGEEERGRSAKALSQLETSQSPRQSNSTRSEPRHSESPNQPIFLATSAASESSLNSENSLGRPRLASHTPSPRRGSISHNNSSSSLISDNEEPENTNQVQLELQARYALLAEDRRAAQEEERARRVADAKKRVMERRKKEAAEKERKKMLAAADGDSSAGEQSDMEVSEISEDLRLPDKPSEAESARLLLAQKEQLELETRKIAEEAQRQKEEDARQAAEKIRLEKERIRLEEEAKKRKEEEERLRMEEERLLKEEQRLEEERKAMEAEEARRKEEEELKRQAEEARRLAEEQKRRDEEEAKRIQLEKEEEEERLRVEEDEKRAREAEELQRQLEEERAAKELEREAKEQLRADKLKKAQQRKALRASSKLEVEKMRLQEETRRKNQLSKQKAVAEKRRKDREAKKQKELEEKRKQEEEARKLKLEQEIEEQTRRIELERVRLQEEQERQEREEEYRKFVEEKRRRIEEERRRIEEERERLRHAEEEEARKRAAEEVDRQAREAAEKSKREEEAATRRGQDIAATGASSSSAVDEVQRIRAVAERMQKEATSLSQSTLKDWNDEYQMLEELEDDDDEFKFTAQAGLVKDFCSVAEVYGKVIISEAYLDEKSISPLPDHPNRYLTQGIEFRVFLDEIVGQTEAGDDIWKYGGEKANHAIAMKAARSMLKAHNALLSCRTPGLCYPLLTLLNYRGTCLIAQAQAPVSHDDASLLYGFSADGKFHADLNISSLLNQVGRILNLKEHVDGEGNTYFGPRSLKVKVGSDERFYVSGYANLLPCEAPDEGLVLNSSDKAQTLHPRILSRLPNSFVSEVLYEGQTGPQVAEETQNVVTSTAHIYESEIPLFAQVVSNNEQWDVEHLVTQLHYVGLSIRHLGYVRAYLGQMGDTAVQRRAILTECVARCLKNQVRHEVRESQRVYKSMSEEPYRRTVYQFLRPVLSYQTPAPSYFELSGEEEWVDFDFEGCTVTTRAPELASPTKNEVEEGGASAGPDGESAIAEGGEQEVEDVLSLVTVEANFSIPIPWRQKTFFMELKIQTCEDYFAFGLCGTAPHNGLFDITGYSISSAGELWIQGKSYSLPFAWKNGDVIGVFYNWRGKQIMFTHNDKIAFATGIAKGAYIPKLTIGKYTSLSYNFGPNFVYDVESLCERLSVETPIVEDDSVQFWQHDLKEALETSFPQCLSLEDLAHNHNLRTSVDLEVLARRLVQLTGMELSERVHTYLREDPLSSFTLAPYDIVRLGSSLARMDVHDFPEGVIQLLDVMKRGFKLDKEGNALLASAHQKLDSVFLRVPVINPQHYHYYAAFYHHASIVNLGDSSTSAVGLRFQRNALEIYNDALASFERHRQGAATVGEQRRESNWRTVLAKGILLCEMDAEEDGVSLFYQVRGESEEGDDLLTHQLESYEEQLKTTQNVGHIRRIMSTSMTIGEACLDPCTAIGCLAVAKVVLAGLRFLSIGSVSDSWNSLYDDYLVRVGDFLEAISIEDPPLFEEFLADCLYSVVDHFTLTSLIKMASLCEWLIVPIATALSKAGEITLIHPSLLLSKIINETLSMWPEEDTQVVLLGLVSNVIQTRSVNQWLSVQSNPLMSKPPPPLYGASLTALNGLLYLFGGDTGDECLDKLYIYNPETNVWKIAKDSGDFPSARKNHSANAIDDTTILVYGGKGDDYLDDAYLFDTKTLNWTVATFKGTKPSARSGFSTVMVGEKQLWFLGGKESGVSTGFSEVYVLEIDTFTFSTKVTWGDIPPPDFNFGCAYANDVIYKYGGEVSSNVLFALNTRSLKWYPVNTGGASPTSQDTQDSLSYVPVKDKLVMFGLAKDVFALHLGCIPNTHPLYSDNYDPFGTSLVAGNRQEVDSSEYPADERLHFASVCVDANIFTFGGVDSMGRALNDLYAYDLELNTWETFIPDTEELIPELFGSSMVFYDNKFFIFGGMEEEGGEATNMLYCLDLESNEWSTCTVNYLSSDRSSLHPRAFHVSALSGNLLILTGGIDADVITTVDVVNLDTFEAEQVTVQGDLPVARIKPSYVVVEDRILVLGGCRYAEGMTVSIADDDDRHPLDIVDIFDISTWSWESHSLSGPVPKASTAISICNYNQYLFTYAGGGEVGASQLSVLNLDTGTWRGSIDLASLPVEGHRLFQMGDKLFILENGFELSFLEIDAGDRMGLMKQTRTYGKRHRGKRASVAVLSDTLIYAYGGLTGEEVSNQFTCIDMEPDSFQEDEIELQQLPSFAEQCRHIRVTVGDVEGLFPRDDDQVSDPFVQPHESEWVIDDQRSNPVTGTLNPTFNHDIFFYEVAERETPKALLEIRDAKDETLLGACYVPLGLGLRMCTKPGKSASFEKLFKLTDPLSQAVFPVGGTVFIKLTAF